MAYIIGPNKRYLHKMSNLNNTVYSMRFDWMKLFIRDANRRTVDI